MADYKDLNQTQLYSSLGYDKHNPTPGRDHQTLWDLTHVFFKEYEFSTGRRIPPGRKVDIQEAHLCALDFLEQREVPYKLFPPTEESFLVWPDDQDEITIAVAHIFRLCAHYAESGRAQKRVKANVATRKDGARIEKKAVSKKRPRSPKPKTRPRAQIDDTDSVSDEDDITEFAPGVLSLDQNPGQPKSWKKPPRRFSTCDGRAYIKGLKPQPNPPNRRELIDHWFSKEGSVWPEFADKALQRILHDKNIYSSIKLKSNKIRSITEKLIRSIGVQVTHEPQLANLETHVRDRMAELTDSFVDRHFIAFEINGVPKKSERFLKLWDSREEHWKASVYDVSDSSDDPDIPQPKRRRKRRVTKSQRTQSSLVFPNLGDEHNGIRSMSELAMLAENALGACNQRQGRGPNDVPLEATKSLFGQQQSDIQSRDLSSPNHETIEVQVPKITSDSRIRQTLSQPLTSVVEQVASEIAARVDSEQLALEIPRAQLEKYSQGVHTAQSKKSTSFLPSSFEDVPSEDEISITNDESYISTEALELLQSYEMQNQIPPDRTGTAGGNSILNLVREMKPEIPNEQSPSSPERLEGHVSPQKMADQLAKDHEIVRSQSAGMVAGGSTAAAPSISQPSLCNSVDEIFPTHSMTSRKLSLASSQESSNPSIDIVNALPTAKEKFKLDFNAIRQELTKPTTPTIEDSQIQNNSMKSPISISSESSIEIQELLHNVCSSATSSTISSRPSTVSGPRHPQTTKSLAPQFGKPIHTNEPVIPSAQIEVHKNSQTVSPVGVMPDSAQRPIQKGGSLTNEALDRDAHQPFLHACTKPWDYSPRHDSDLTCPPNCTRQIPADSSTHSAPFDPLCKSGIRNEYFLEFESRTDTSPAALFQPHSNAQGKAFGKTPEHRSSFNQQADATRRLPSWNLPPIHEALQAQATREQISGRQFQPQPSPLPKNPNRPHGCTTAVSSREERVCNLQFHSSPGPTVSSSKTVQEITIATPAPRSLMTGQAPLKSVSASDASLTSFHGPGKNQEHPILGIGRTAGAPNQGSKASAAGPTMNRLSSVPQPHEKCPPPHTQQIQQDLSRNPQQISKCSNKLGTFSAAKSPDQSQAIPPSLVRDGQEVEVLSTQPVHQSTTQIHAPCAKTFSPLHLSESERRRPYSLVPPPMRYSKFPDSNPDSSSQIVLSSDTTLTLHSNSSSAPDGEVEALVLIFQKSDLDYDFEKKVPFSILEESNPSQFFFSFAKKTGASLSSLEQLTFQAMFGNKQSFVVGRYEGEGRWQATTNNLNNMYQRELKKNRKKGLRRVEEIWVEIGNTKD